jgi:ferredoxin/coenzyme F420-reducing hydrogenase delta subunit
LYAWYETSVAGAWTSVEWLTHEQGQAGAIMRSLHRYASDAFVAVAVLHLLRELALGRYRGFRWYSWLSGLPTLWLLVASGVVGYWLVWDALAQFVAIATVEWFGALPGFGPALARNFIAEPAVSDRLFSLLAFLHIGLPLVLLLEMWAHVQRLTRPRTLVSRAVAAWSLAALLAASLAQPAVSQAPADLGRVSARLPIDWFYLAPLAATYASSPEFVWALAAALTLLLGIAPWLGATPRAAPAQVDPANCNGCARCFADCPFAAIAMAPHPRGRGQIAVVDADRCAACGICAGACPSSSPFREGERLVSGIELPWLTIGGLRDRFDAALAARRTAGTASPQRSTALPAAGTPAGPAPPVAVFGCRHGAAVGDLAGPEVVAVELPCIGMLPPSFVDYALRRGVSGVVVAACPPEDCEFRFGARWTGQRLAGAREPRLRAAADRRRLRLVHAAREDRPAVHAAVVGCAAAVGDALGGGHG